MANPGSPEAMKAAQSSAPQTPGMSSSTMIGMFATLIIMMVVMQFRQQIGEVLNYVFKYVDFGGQYPVLTLIVAGAIMITLSTVIRGVLSDPIAQARSQHIQSEFNNEMRQARTENNLYKMKKLQEIQPQMMAASMEQSGQMMKLMPVTMVIVIPIYAWIWYFVNNTVPLGAGSIINMPWGTADLNAWIWFMPIWIIIYTLISLPLGQLENKIINYIMFKRRLKKIDAGEA